MRPPANVVLERLDKFKTSLLNKYTLEAPSAVSAVTIIFANHIQSLWAVMEYPCRSHDDPDVTKTAELISIHQHDVTRLEIKVSVYFLSSNNKCVCVCVHCRRLINYHQIMPPFVLLNLVSGSW